MAIQLKIETQIKKFMKKEIASGKVIIDNDKKYMGEVYFQIKDVSPTEMMTQVNDAVQKYLGVNKISISDVDTFINGKKTTMVSE